MLNWLTIVFTLVGGLAIFLYGMNLMSEGVNQSAGRKIRKMLESFTRNRFTALTTGAIATTIIQSSSAVSVMVISLVKANILKFSQTFGILLGAAIGTTITAQIIAFKITDYALLIIAVGFFLNLAAKNNVLKTTGSAMMGFGLLFYGLHLMSEAMYPLRDYDPFLQFLTRLDHPVAGILAGLVFTAIIQSSSAFIGIVIVLASQGLINLEAGVALLLGSNIGTTFTAAIASLNAGYEAKRVAVAFFMIKTVGVLMIVWWIPHYSELIRWITTGSVEVDQATLARQIANAHTLFNLMVTVALLPFTNKFSYWIMKLVPAKDDKITGPVEVKYIDNTMVGSPALALSLAKKETMHMVEYVRQMLQDAILPFTNKDSSVLPSITSNEEKVDHLRVKIAAFITRVSQGEMRPTLVGEAFRIHYIISEMEQIADVVSGELLDKGMEFLENEMDFSEEGRKDLQEFHTLTLEQFEKTVAVLETLDQKEAAYLKANHRRFRQLSDELKRRHFNRLARNVQQSVVSSKTHMEVMGALRIIHSHFRNMVRIIMDKEKMGDE
jgi:phosphate:Na+ symporter